LHDGALKTLAKGDIGGLSPDEGLRRGAADPEPGEAQKLIIGGVGGG
jgi:hypothetical protein